MSGLASIGLGDLREQFASDPPGVYYFTRQQALQRVLEFTGYSLDDVMNDPIARREVSFYYCLHRYLERELSSRGLRRERR